jgi:2-hydroxychromene-2-carboxylate isomerase
MASVEFYFDYSCPWSYLACMRLIETATRTGSSIEWRPIVVDTLLARAHPDHPVDREPLDPRKFAYEARDIEAWAHYVGVDINRPDDWPASAALAARGAVVAARQERIRAYSEAVFSAYFGSGADIADISVLSDLAEKAGLERQSFEQALIETGVVEGVDANIESLLRRGGFGAPTMFVGDDMFFGSDRMPLVEFALGQSSGREFVMPGQHG